MEVEDPKRQILVEVSTEQLFIAENYFRYTWNNNYTQNKNDQISHAFLNGDITQAIQRN